MRRTIVQSCSWIALSAAFAASGAAAQESTIDEVVVTGSFISGAAKNTALPVDVVTAADLEKRGSPSIETLIRSLPASGAVLGPSNQFNAGGSEGTGTVNLRGLGPQRTLVLLNGRRMAPYPGGSGHIDTNLMPIDAIGRVEVLKEGAAATYGSDAVAGVVNFITKTNANGLDLSASYTDVKGSDGDYTVGASYGWNTDRLSVFVAGGYQHRSALPVTARDWAVQPFFNNPQGGWQSSGNPGAFAPILTTAAGGLPAGTITGAVVRDPGCAVLGSFPGVTGATETCYLNSPKFDNIIEEEHHYQLFGSLSFDVSDAITAYADALWAKNDVPHQQFVPGYTFTQFPTATTSPGAVAGRFYVPNNNPGAVDMFAKNPAFGAAVRGPAGVGGTGLILYRTFGEGGIPTTDGPQTGVREFEAWRISAGLKGKVAGVSWDANITHSEDDAHRVLPDVLGQRLQLALSGLGGPNCTGTTPGANGCLWYNPFSNGIQRNVITGETNPQYNAAVANSVALVEWLTPPIVTDSRTELTTYELVLNGVLGFELPGGAVGWAAGGQHRTLKTRTTYSDFANQDLFPCFNLQDKVCPGGAGPYIFLTGGRPSAYESNINAVFGELSLPLMDTLSAQLAIRHEDYDRGVGSTTNPKLSVRWQPIQALTLRGSVGTTFRGPPPAAVSTDFSTAVNFVGPVGAFRAIDYYGNPSLKPEKATTYSLGAIVQLGGFRGSVDYWNFDFEDPLTVEPAAALVSSMISAGRINCAGAFRAQLILDNNNTCVQGVTAPANIARIRSNNINGPRVRTSGVDVDLGQSFDDVWGGGRLNLGLIASYILEYKVAELRSNGALLQAAYDGVGFLNQDRGFNPLPELRGSAYVEYANGAHNLRLTANYTASYIDNRTDIFVASVPSLLGGKKIREHVTWDLNYGLQLPWDSSVTLSATNIFDKDPPFVRADENFDPYTASPLGRTLKVSVRKHF